MDKMITVGIPAYKSQGYIANAIASIKTQTMIDKVSIIIGSDNPDDDYTFLLAKFPELDITILPCEKNTGPGLARQRCLEACKTEWITFMDADDVFFTPYALNNMVQNIKDYNTVMVQALFYQEIKLNERDLLLPMGQGWHPWVFGKLYRVAFLKEFGIKFDNLLSMEDGEFNSKINIIVSQSDEKYNIVMIEDFSYLWHRNEKNSITSYGADENGGIPLYTVDACPFMAVESVKRAFEFCKGRGINQFMVEQFWGLAVDNYFAYQDALANNSIFKDQLYFTNKKLYHDLYKYVKELTTSEIINKCYNIKCMSLINEGRSCMTSEPFQDFLNKVVAEPYGGKKEFEEIRSKLPEWVLKMDEEHRLFNVSDLWD